MQKLYCSKSDIENYLVLSIDVAFDDQIDIWINAVSEMVRVMTNRDWLADTTANARLFNGSGNGSIEVGDFIGTPVVEIGEDYATGFVATTNFITSPYNSENKTDIVMKNETIPYGIQNVRVTAKWGYGATVPNDIKQAVTILASAIVLAGTNQDGEIESEKIGNYTVKYKNDQHKDDAKMAMDIINSRRVIRL